MKKHICILILFFLCSSKIFAVMIGWNWQKLTNDEKIAYLYGYIEEHQNHVQLKDYFIYKLSDVWIKTEEIYKEEICNGVPVNIMLTYVVLPALKNNWTQEEINKELVKWISVYPIDYDGSLNKSIDVLLEQ